MARNEIEMHLPKIDDLFTTQEERDSVNLEKIVNINLNEIDDFPEHPFKVVENDEMKDMMESIQDKGVLVPTIVRKKENGRYEMISGHRRKKASELLNLETLPCIVRDLTNDEATIIMVDSNLQREKILPSEKAFAYKMKLSALSHQGNRNDLTSCPVGTKLSSAKELGNKQGDSERQVYRYVRLTELIPELLEMVDNEKIAFRPAVELSYLTQDEQYQLLDCIEYTEATPSLAQAIKLKKLSQNNKLTTDDIDEIMSQRKPNQIETYKFDKVRIRGVLPRNIEEDKIEDYVIKSIEFYSKYLKQKEMNVR